MNIENDEALNSIYNAKYQRAESEVNTLKAYPDMTTEDLSKVVDLSLEKTQLENNPSEAAKTKLSIVNKDIKNITDKYAISKSSPEEIPLQKQPRLAQQFEGRPGTNLPERVRPKKDKPPREKRFRMKLKLSESPVEKLIEEETDSKGRAIKRFATTTEKDGKNNKFYI